MRRLKRIVQGDSVSFTIETKADQKRENLLCKFCAWSVEVPGHPACETYTGLQKSAKNGVGLLVRSCKVYQPILTFRKPLKGLEGEFNTFRLGPAWAHRVAPGVIVGLGNRDENDRIFGKAVVTKVHFGGYEEMCKKFAKDNHMLVESTMTRKAAAEAMTKIMRNAYGKIVVEQAEDISVIYFKRLPE